jgi:hypothetical protein
MASIWLAVAMVERAKITMNAVTTCAHTNTGMRLTVIPGARSLNVVTMMLMAAMSPAISVKVIIWAHVSMRLPGEYSGPESGTYANHPASGPMSTSCETQSRMPPQRNTQ